MIIINVTQCSLQQTYTRHTYTQAHHTGLDTMSLLHQSHHPPHHPPGWTYILKTQRLYSNCCTSLQPAYAVNYLVGRPDNVRHWSERLGQTGRTTQQQQQRHRAASTRLHHHTPTQHTHTHWSASLTAWACLNVLINTM